MQFSASYNCAQVEYNEISLAFNGAGPRRAVQATCSGPVERLFGANLPPVLSLLSLLMCACS